MMPPIVHPFVMGLLRATDSETRVPLSSEDHAWEKIIRDATSQGLLPLLYRWLKTSDGTIQPPASQLAQIEKGMWHLAARNVLLAHELNSILRAFEARQVHCAPIRGLTLAELLYGDITARPMGDLDLLVQKGDLPKVAESLGELGFEEMDRRSGFAATFYYTLKFVKDRHGSVIVEPHWTIAYPPFVDRVNMEAVWQRCVRGRVVGMETWLLAREDLLVHLCLHVIHRGESAPLLWFYELDRFLRQEKAALDWAQVVDLSRQSGLGLFLAQVLGKVKSLFDSPVPDQVLSRISAPLAPTARPAIERRLVRLLAGESNVDGAESFALLFTIKGIRAKLYYAFALLFPSPQFMILHYGLSSRRQLVLSYLSRVVRLAWEGFKGLLSLFFSGRIPRQSPLR